MTVETVARRVVPAALRPMTAAYARLRPAIRILMYHRVDRVAGFDQLVVRPERFEEQMAYLARHHRVVPLAEAVRELSVGVQRSAVAVTFDDGYRDTLTQALPILQRHGIPATVFVTTDFCGRRGSHPRYGSTRRADLHLDWEDVRTLRRAGLAIGSHTLSHPHLTRLPPAEARREIVESRRLIEDTLGSEVEAFSYPSGDFGRRELVWVGEAGYRAAVSVAPGGNRPGISLYALRRTEVTDRDRAAELSAKLDGAFDMLHTLLHLRRQREVARLAYQEGGAGV